MQDFFPAPPAERQNRTGAPLPETGRSKRDAVQKTGKKVFRIAKMSYFRSDLVKAHENKRTIWN